jgi:hypothetical protein
MKVMSSWRKGETQRENFRLRENQLFWRMKEADRKSLEL